MAVRPRTTPTGGSTPGYNLPPDLFVLVRPPPSNHSHSLNLQIQLLVPSTARTGPGGGGDPNTRRSGEYSRSPSRNGSIAEEGPSRVGSCSTTNGSMGGNSAVSFDAIAGASVSRSGSRSSDNHEDQLRGSEANGSSAASGGEELSRTTSRGSTRSRGSTNSMSVRSDTTSASGNTRRRVTPLLNLNFHSVLPTVVTDAGTDQRVAKFLRRGIEISSLGIIDPIDLSQPPPSPALHSTPNGATISPQISPPATSPNASASSTPTNNLFTKFKRFTLGQSAQSPKSSPNSTPQQAQMPSSPSNSSFSLFQRSTSTSSNLSSTSTLHPSSSKFLPSLGNSEGAPTPRTVPLLRTGSDDATATQSTISSSRPPRNPPSTSNSSQPVGYAFVVRKWLRDDLIQISEPGGVPGSNTAVRIEWVRASDQEYKRMGKRSSRSRSKTNLSEGGPISPSRRSSEVVEGVIPEVVPEDEELKTTPQSPQPMSASPTSDGTGFQEDEEDDGESSDPEDSERPFICTLFYPSSSSSSSSSAAPVQTSTNSPSSPTKSAPTSSSMQPSVSLRRLQLATLRPAPHHPKLIATLLLPPTLPSIPLGTFSPSQGLQGGVLSNETLRDLVHVTSMWISIREGLGGLGREKDTQNIAAGLGLVKVKSGKVGRTFRGLKR